MESFEEPSHLNRDNLLEVPSFSDSGAEEEEDVKATIKPHYSPLPRRRSSASSEDAELEVPSTIARKVSFADAFGFNLVSVKEFDTWEVPTAPQGDIMEDENVPVDEFFLAPLFVLPTENDVMQKLYKQKVLLESVHFLPRLTSMKGIIRVLNVAFEKLVYVRISLDAWQSYYDILAEYMPESYDGETDQFFFKISLVPPYQKEGTKIEFCIRYETPVGIFWANNNEENYVLVCQKENWQETDKPMEDLTERLKKSCLKTSQSKEGEEETLVVDAEADEWNKAQTTVAAIPEIVCHHNADHAEESDENIENGNIELSEDNEKEIEHLLSQHFAGTSSVSSEDEKNVYTSEQVNFPNEPQRVETELALQGTSVDLRIQPLHLTAASDNNLVEPELQDARTHFTERYISHPSAEEYANVAANNGELSFQCTDVLSKEDLPETEQNETIHITDALASRAGIRFVDISNGKIDSAPGSEMIEQLIIREETVDTYGEACEMRPETISSEHDDESGQLVEALDDNANPAPDLCTVQVSSMTPDSLLTDNIDNDAKMEEVVKNDEVKLEGKYIAGLQTSGASNNFTKIHELEEATSGVIYNRGDLMDEENKLDVSLVISEEAITCPFSLNSCNLSEDHSFDAQSTRGLSTSDNKEEVSAMSDPFQVEDSANPRITDAKSFTESQKFLEFMGLKGTGTSDTITNEGLEKIHFGLESEEKEAYGDLSDTARSTDNKYLDAFQSMTTCALGYNPAVEKDKASSTCPGLLNKKQIFDDKKVDQKAFEVMTSENMGRQDQDTLAPKERLETDLYQPEVESEKPDWALQDNQNKTVSENKSVSVPESQLLKGECDANVIEQIKEEADDEDSWRVNDYTSYLHSTPTEVFTSEEIVKTEVSSIADDTIAEEKAASKPYIIKPTSENTVEGMLAGEKETVESNRPVEEKEIVFQKYEGRSECSQYTFCQNNTVGATDGISFKKESRFDFQNVDREETLEKENISNNENHATAKDDVTNILTIIETVPSILNEGEVLCGQDLYFQEAPEILQHFEQDPVTEVASDLSFIDERKPPSFDTNLATYYYYSSSSETSPDVSSDTAASTGDTIHPITVSSFECRPKISPEPECNPDPTSEISFTLKNLYSSDEPREAETNSLSLSDQESESDASSVCQPGSRHVESLGPVILISEPNEEEEEGISDAQEFLAEEIIMESSHA
ncbi:protein phosphatase 1 regulatory subunit 3A isoform X2 [Rhinatrema bivittatum]|uniref:protein phosphatase 1 regulatory subunit 3A isoform X2 n=1 Tax=Rhinatrema bivittatum TaxID=194408 RepID=UPI001128156B|nr:protein phosphatase 1 regulatory subunit 3A isoform X2 [Rhinatrema bivittatum]